MGDTGYDSNEIRNLLESMGITPCILGRSMRNQPIQYDKELYRQRHKIENAFSKLKDWRRVVTRYEPLPGGVRVSLCFRRNGQILAVI